MNDHKGVWKKGPMKNLQSLEPNFSKLKTLTTSSYNLQNNYHNFRFEL